MFAHDWHGTCKTIAKDVFRLRGHNMKSTASLATARQYHYVEGDNYAFVSKHINGQQSVE
jgi:hypothetical protein